MIERGIKLKVKIFIVTLIATILIFLGVVGIEKKIINYTPTKDAVFAIGATKGKEKLDITDFTVRKVPISQITEGTVTNLSELKEMYAKENIYAGDILNKNRIAKYSELYNYELKPGEREIALNFKSVDACVGGTLRKDDIVDIEFTSSPSGLNSNAVTKTLIQGIRILGAKDASGKYIDEANKDLSAVTLLIAATPEKSALISNNETKGKFKLLKVPDSDKESTYTPVIVIDGNLAK